MLKKPIFVALDVDSGKEALLLAEKVAGHVGGFKVGPRLLIKEGGRLIEKLATFGPVFVDNKYFDIPNTMESSVQATFDAGASFCTVHAQAGREALQRLARLEKELNQQRPFKILCVTVLTSFNQMGLPPTCISEPISNQVDLLTRLSFDCGLSGLVCSAHEVARLRSKWPNNFYVTPGIRIDKINNDDQKRTLNPKEAIRQGASALVVGRPITEAPQPEVVAREIDESLSELK